MRRFGFFRLEDRRVGLPTKGGWRLTLPICPFWRQGYDVLLDEFATGWWVTAVFIAFERIDLCGGAWGVRLIFGLLPPRAPHYVGRARAV